MTTDLNSYSNGIDYKTLVKTLNKPLNVNGNLELISSFKVNSDRFQYILQVIPKDNYILIVYSNFPSQGNILELYDMPDKLIWSRKVANFIFSDQKIIYEDLSDYTSSDEHEIVNNFTFYDIVNNFTRTFIYPPNVNYSIYGNYFLFWNDKYFDLWDKEIKRHYLTGDWSNMDKYNCYLTEDFLVLIDNKNIEYIYDIKNDKKGTKLNIKIQGQFRIRNNTIFSFDKEYNNIKIIEILSVNQIKISYIDISQFNFNKYTKIQELDKNGCLLFYTNGGYNYILDLIKICQFKFSENFIMDLEGSILYKINILDKSIEKYKLI